MVSEVAVELGCVGVGVYSVASAHGWGRLKEGKAAWSRDKRARELEEARGS